MFGFRDALKHIYEFEKGLGICNLAIFVHSSGE